MRSRRAVWCVAGVLGWCVAACGASTDGALYDCTVCLRLHVVEMPPQAVQFASEDYRGFVYRSHVAWVVASDGQFLNASALSWSTGDETL